MKNIIDIIVYMHSAFLRSPTESELEVYLSLLQGIDAKQVEVISACKLSINRGELFSPAVLRKYIVDLRSIK